MEGSVAVAGAALSWLKDNLEVLPSFGEVESIAAGAELMEEGDIYFVPAFSGLYAPYWHQEARGYVDYYQKYFFILSYACVILKRLA